MNITLNNRPEYFEGEDLSIDDILRLKNFTFKMMVVKVNGKLVKKSQYSLTRVVDGDALQLIHMISGG